MKTLNTILLDLHRYTGKKGCNFFNTLHTLYYEPAFLTIVLYRIANRIICIKNLLLRIILKIFIIWILQRIIEIIIGVEINDKAEIGPGLYIGHSGNVFIGNTKIGSNCNISHEVTIGFGKQDTKNEGIPIIGNNVYIGPGAKLFGKICIGDNVSIGANAVVSKNIPNNSIVLGNPGRIIGYQKYNENIHNTVLNPENV